MIYYNKIRLCDAKEYVYKQSNLKNVWITLRHAIKTLNSKVVLFKSEIIMYAHIIYIINTS